MPLVGGKGGVPRIERGVGLDLERLGRRARNGPQRGVGDPDVRQGRLERGRLLADRQDEVVRSLLQ